jgi:hypothetical protein
MSRFTEEQMAAIPQETGARCSEAGREPISNPRAFEKESQVVPVQSPLRSWPVHRHCRSSIPFAPYQGDWVDGAMLDNLPLHAFDAIADHSATGSSKAGQSPTLNPNTLSFKLIPGGDPNDGPGNVALDPSLYSAVGRSMIGSRSSQLPDFSQLFAPFGEFLRLMMDTFLFQGAEGQILNAAENDQVVALYSGDISTLNFSPPDSLSRPVIDAAARKVANYFR